MKLSLKVAFLSSPKNDLGKEDGWVLFPVKSGKEKAVLPPPALASKVIGKAEWKAESEACGQSPDGIVYKAAPIDEKKNALTNFQEALGKGLRFLSTRKVKRAVVVLPSVSQVPMNVFEGLFEVPDLMAFDATPYKTKPEAKKTLTLQEIVFAVADKKDLKSLQKLLIDCRIISAAVNVARRLVDKPGNLLPPNALAREALLLKKDGVKVSLLPDGIVRKMGGVQAVSAGSPHAPEVIFLELNPGKSKPIVLVGKGVTFDSGGISLKPAENMGDMKGDMAGGAAVIAAMKALANLGCKKRVIGIVPAVENMPDGKAARPGDVITMFDGQTVEIGNTDAEGRLILADCLAYVSRFKPIYTIDLATLTGAVLVAIGDRISGLFCNDPDLEKRLKAAAEASGDLIWPLPLHQSFVDEMRSPFADWKNSGGRLGGACLGAGFLSVFATGPWAHLDIAGGAQLHKEKSFFPKGGTGLGVKLLVKLIMA